MIISDKRTLAEYLDKYILQMDENIIEKIIEIPPPEFNYTYALPLFQLAKIQKKSPQKIANELKEQFLLPSFLEEIEVQGPYLNFRVNKATVLRNIMILGENYGKLRQIKVKEKKTPQKIVIEYPSPNTNKPLHLGHIRNLLIGSSLSRIFEYMGEEVYQVNLYNDRGIHICKSMLAYRKCGDNTTPDKKPDHFVGDYYVLYNKLEEKDESLLDEAMNLLKKWEDGDKEVRKLWKKLNEWCIKGIEETIQRMDISIDKNYFESEHYKKGKDIVEQGYKNNLFKKTDDGAIFAPLSENSNLPDKVLLRSDGTSIYITQDIYLATLKKEDFNYDKSIYVVGSEQNLYFKQLFAVLDILGFTEDKYHFSYGMIYLPEGKMKSREGTTVDADDLIEEMEQLAYKEVSKRYSQLDENEKIIRSKLIGDAALKFYVMKIHPKTDIIYNPEESISFEGETGPYVQYVYARIQSILDKSEIKINDKSEIDFNLLENDKELKLIRQLNYLPEILSNIAKNYDLHSIPQYLLTLCQIFNSFYSSCPVIQENKELQKARLYLIKCIQIVIRIGLNLIGIEVLNEM